MKSVFSGWPEGVFLYKFLLDQEWKYTVPRPDVKLFDGKHFLLLEDLHYTCQSGVVHTAERGQVSDGGSIRTPVGWALLSTPFQRYLPAYLVHDHFCDEADDLIKEGLPDSAWDVRRFGDDLFPEMLLDLGASYWDAWKGHKAVRLAGWWNFLLV